jgi:enolase-phosphatase E1
MENGKWKMIQPSALSLSEENISAILLDIEGTTTPIAFVYDVLFPFARARAKNYLEVQFDSAAVQQDLERLQLEHDVDVAQNLNPPALIANSIEEAIDSMAAYLYWLMDRDRKSTGLKSLQGKIWQHGYADGQLKSQVFADVPPAFERWHKAELNLSIFSSGSVLAQKLLFAHTEAGNLTKFLDRYFDTTTGPKADAESYRRIAAELHRAPAETLFISDVVAELDAARLAGLKTLLCVRPGNHPQTQTHTHESIQTFAEITG